MTITRQLLEEQATYVRNWGEALAAIVERGEVRPLQQVLIVGREARIESPIEEYNLLALVRDYLGEATT